jgi:hypothetical protein
MGYEASHRQPSAQVFRTSPRRAPISRTYLGAPRRRAFQQYSGISILESPTRETYTHPPPTCQAPRDCLHLALWHRPGSGAPDASRQLQRRKEGSEGHFSGHLPVLRTLKARILTAQLWFRGRGPRYPRRRCQRRGALWAPSQHRPEQRPRQLTLRQQQPVVPGVLDQPPPVFTNRCWRLVSHHLPTRNGRTTRRYKFPNFRPAEWGNFNRS